MDENQTPLPRRRRKRKKRVSPVLIVIILIIIAAAVYTGVKYYLPSYKIISIYEYDTKLDDTNIQLVLKDEMLYPDNFPVVRDGEVYLPVDFIKKYVDMYIYWDSSAEKLTITTEYRVIQMKTEDLTYYVNREPMTLNLPVYAINGMAYMPKIFLEEYYGITIQYTEESNIVFVDYTAEDKEIAQVDAKKVWFRYEPDKKSPAISKLSMGEEVITYEETDEYTKIRTNDGFIGYVLTDKLADFATAKGFVKEEEPIDFPDPKAIEGKICLVWDQINTVEQNSAESSRIIHKGLDVLSPTWFSFEREDYSGEMITIADMGYVNWAHENGYQVWPRIYDDEDGEVTAQIFADQEKREYAIKQILAYVSLYNADGINIDFERVREADVEYFHQFLRELWPLLREQGVILSVDTFVPRVYSMYYNRGEIAKTVDYICVMTYDENTYGDTSGPNASMPFVEEGVISTLEGGIYNKDGKQIPIEGVPPEKLLMSVPFYSRVWIESQTDTGIQYDLRSLGMNYAYRMFTENGAVFEWQEDLGCYYGEFDIIEDGIEKTYKTWLEDENSMAVKLALIEKYNLAGVSAWVRDLEKEEIWDLMYDMLKN